MHPGLAVALSYAAGSIPAAYIAGRLSGVDLRRHGSGNLGATNVIRVLGAKIGALVFAFDVAKGALPVLLLPPRVPSVDPVLLGIACGIAAIVGHTRPLFLLFGKGGKGVATAAGVFLALAPIPTALTLVIFAVVLMSSGYVSLGSLVSAVMLPVLVFVATGPRSPVLAMAILVAAFVFFTHRANIARLRRGEEHRFGKRGAPVRWGIASVAIGVVVLIAVVMAARFA